MFSSPPASNQRRGTFMADSSRLPYYEDLYGTRNEDEEFDRFPEECKESSSEEESKSGPLANLSFFKQHIGKPTKPSSKATQHSSTQPVSFNESLTSKANNASTKPRTSIGSKSATTRKTKKLRVPNKFGMFTTPIIASNTAGEAMDDLLQATMLGDLDDGFPTLDEDASSQELPKRNLNATSSTRKINYDVTRDRPSKDEYSVSKLGAGATSDGDIEDNGFEIDMNWKGRKGSMSDKKLAGRRGPKQARKTSKGSSESGRRRSKRQEEIETEKQRAEKQATRSSRRISMTKPDVTELKASNKKKMIEHAALSRSREKAKARKPKAERGAEHTGETVNEKEAKVLQAKAGVVMVAGDEVDFEMYERF